MGGNRSAVWALIGVALGFTMPVLACVGFGLIFTFGFGLFASQAAPSAIAPVHVSGPPTGPAVALIDISGPIVSGQAGPFDTGTVAASGDLIPLIEQAAADPEVRALVLRVNSPGGGVVPSDEIYESLRDTGKPIVVLMGDLAASGGYYISMAADYIVANPSTLTGSIGVISQFPNAEELLDRLGIEFTVIKSGQVKDIGSPYRPMTEEERALWQSIIDETYNRFVRIVADGRNLPEDEVRALADGRIFTGSQALELGLIDALGYEDEAISKASELGDIPGEPRVVRYVRPRSFASLFGASLGGGGLSLTGIPVDWVQRLLAPSLEYRWIP